MHNRKSVHIKLNECPKEQRKKPEKSCTLCYALNSRLDLKMSNQTLSLTQRTEMQNRTLKKAVVLAFLLRPASGHIPKVSQLGPVSRRYRLTDKLKVSKLASRGPHLAKGDARSRRSPVLGHPAPSLAGTKVATLEIPHGPHETFGREVTGRVPGGPQIDSAAHDVPSLDVILVGRKVEVLGADRELGAQRPNSQTANENYLNASPGESPEEQSSDNPFHEGSDQQPQQPTQMEPMIVDVMPKPVEPIEEQPEISNFNSFQDVDNIVRKYTAIIEARSRELRSAPGALFLEEDVADKAQHPFSAAEFEQVFGSRESAEEGSQGETPECDCSMEKLPTPLTVKSLHSSNLMPPANSHHASQHSSVESVQKEVFMEPEMVTLVASNNNRLSVLPTSNAVVPKMQVALRDHKPPEPTESIIVDPLRIWSYKGDQGSPPKASDDDIRTFEEPSGSNLDISWMEPARQEMVVTSLRAVMQNRASKRPKLERRGQTAVDAPKTFSFAKFTQLQENYARPSRRQPDLLELESARESVAVSPRDSRPVYAETLEDLKRVEGELDESIRMDQYVAAPILKAGTAKAREQPSGGRQNRDVFQIPSSTTHTPSIVFNFKPSTGFSALQQGNDQLSAQLVDSWTTPADLYSTTIFSNLRTSTPELLEVASESVAPSEPSVFAADEPSSSPAIATAEPTSGDEQRLLDTVYTESEVRTTVEEHLTGAPEENANAGLEQQAEVDEQNSLDASSTTIADALAIDEASTTQIQPIEVAPTVELPKEPEIPQAPAPPPPPAAAPDAKIILNAAQAQAAAEKRKNVKLSAVQPRVSASRVAAKTDQPARLSANASPQPGNRGGLAKTGTPVTPARKSIVVSTPTRRGLKSPMLAKAPAAAPETPRQIVLPQAKPAPVSESEKSSSSSESDSDDSDSDSESDADSSDAENTYRKPSKKRLKEYVDTVGAKVLTLFKSSLPAAVEIPPEQGEELYKRVHDPNRRKATMTSEERLRYPVLLETGEDISLTAKNSEKREHEIIEMNRVIEEDEVPIPANLRRRGFFLGQQGEYRLALADFNKSLEYDPFNSDALWYRHQLHLLFGDVQAALRDLDAITEANRQHLGAFQMKGRIYQELGAVKMAVVNYSQVIKLKPYDADAYLQRASLFEQENEMVYANEDYKMVRQLDPTNIPAMRNLAIYSFERRLWTDSNDAFTRLIELNPNDYDAYVYRSRANAHLGRYEDAFLDLSTAVKINPAHPAIFFHRASLLRARNPFKAIEDYSVVLLLEDSNLSVEAYYQRALLYYTLQQYENAASDLETVIRIAPQRAQAHLTLGILYMRYFNDLNEALKCFDRSIAIKPTQTFAYLCRGDLYQLIQKHLRTDESALNSARVRKRVKTAGKYRDVDPVDLTGPAILEHYIDLGVKEYSRAIHIAPYNHVLYLYRGKLLLNLGRMKEATYDFQTAFELNSEIAQTFMQRALVLSFQRKYAQIIEEFNKKSRLETIEDAQLFILVAKARISCKDHEGALKNLAEALKYNKREPEVYLLRGVCYEKLRDWTNAIKEFTPCIHLNPAFSKAYFHRGLCKLHLQDDQGIVDLSKAIKLDPDYFEAYITRASYYQMQGDYQLAIEDCTEALRVEPTSIRAYLLRGACNCKLLQFDIALADFGQAISIDRTSHYAFYNRAVTYQLMHDYENAIKDYSIVMLLYNDSNAYRNRGLIYWRQGDTENALLDLIAARDAFPEDSKLGALLGVCLQTLGRLDESIEQFTAAVKLNPLMREALIARGNVYAAKGDVVTARKDYLRVLHIDPQCTEALVNMAYTLQGEGRRKKAYDLFTMALAVDPNCMAALEGRAVIQFSRSNFFGALVDICKALALDHKNPEYLTNRGVVYQALGDNVSAMQSYKLALKVDPNYAHAHLNEANMYFSQRKWEEALTRYTKTLELAPSTVSAYLNRGIAKAMLNDLSGALEDFNEAGRLNPSIPETFYNRAHVLQLLGRQQEAEEDYTAILELSPFDSLVYNKRGKVRGHRADLSGAMEDFAMAIAQDDLSHGESLPVAAR
ncbi:cytochrome c oxidase subunit 1 [Geranomyces variabilis]|nr:cytochrome c oxidase subunit 1 [Geranomyces variabilis]